MNRPSGDASPPVQLPADLRCVGFDLDDTLHYFRRASGRAAAAVFAEAERRFGIAAEELAAAYRGILRAAQAGHFVEPRTSREFRGERFGALLARFGCDAGDQLDRLLDLYDEVLGAELEPRPGARDALAAAKRAGLLTMVVSEGPHDAQETTIERLGLAADVDLLVTSSAEGTSKGERLFERALARAGCEPAELLFVGDSIERDVAPTTALGIATVYVGEDELPAGSPALRLPLPALAELLAELDRGQRPH